MDLRVEIPDELAGRLDASSGDLSRIALEALAAEAFRHNRLTRAELQRILGISEARMNEIFHRAVARLNFAASGSFDSARARAAGARIRELRKGVNLDREGASVRELAHLGHKY